MAHVVKTIFEELGCSKLAAVACSLRRGRPSRDFMKKAPQSRRNPATGSLAQFVECREVPKASKLQSAMQLVEPRQAEFGRHYEDPLLDVDASSRLGVLQRV